MATRSETTIGGRRLAIFDPANGHQPMVSPDGRFTLVFNGAVYNFKALRTELAGGGWEFRTNCDTEVLLAAYARWGSGCLSRLRGMFAFAVWDDRDRSLFLARDPFGIKPLYYRHDDGKLLFASELNALLASGVFGAQIDPQAITDYLAWFAVPAPRTIYRGVFSLRPGEFATFRDGRFEIGSAWSFSGIPDHRPCQTFEEFTAELQSRLKDTIRAHVLADVPVGAFLSGGLDSAVVVGLMTQATGSALRTFSIAFQESEYSEASAAEATARHFGAQHHTHVLTGAEVANDLDRLLLALDQPTGDGVNTYYASKAAHAGGVTVALSGLGGDELFGGYPAFRDTPRLSKWLPWWRQLPESIRRPIIARLHQGDTRRRKLADVLENATNIHEVGALQRRVFSNVSRRSMVSPDVVAALNPLDPFHPELQALQSDLSQGNPFDIVSAWELRTYMADVLLRDSDVMSMRHSLELRVPFIDRPFIEWLWRQPQRTTPHGGKSALFAAVADIVPLELGQRRKHGFTLPFAIWMKRELRPFLEEAFSDASIDRSGLFARRPVQEFWEGFLVRNDIREWSRVWSLAVLIAFVNRRMPSTSRGASDATAVRSPPNRLKGRTLVMAPEIFSSEGGIPRILQIYLKAVCDVSAEPGQVRLLALNDPAVADQPSANGSGLEISRGCGRNKSQFVRSALELAKGCDTVICGHIRQLPVAWLARQFNRRLRYYLVAHGIEVWRKFSRIERIALRGAERVFCVSDFTRRELLKNCPLAEGRALVLHNALDPFFSIEPGHPLSDCPLTILVVTRLTYADRYKGVQHLIEAMPAIRAALPTAKLRIVGRGDDVARLQKMRDALGVTAAVEFAGYVDDAKLAGEMRSCRLFALPSRKEGFGLVLLEAMAHGRPCLGARAGGIPEVITPDTGVLVDYGDVAGIARAAVDALTRPWDQERILARAREFSFDSFKTRLTSLLQE